MFAEIIDRPEAGEFEELVFDSSTTWKSPDWCWIKFTTDQADQWVGMFRGNFIKKAIAKVSEQVAILTTDSLYLLNVNNRKLLYIDEQTEYRDIVVTPSDNGFFVATYFTISMLNEFFVEEITLESIFDIDYVKFGNYQGNKLHVELDVLNNTPSYVRVNGYIDLINYKIVI